MKKHFSVGYILVVLVLMMIVILCILPFYYVVVVSFSNPLLVKEGQITLYPKGFSLEAYKIVLTQAKFFNAFKVSVMRTVLALIISLSLQCSMAYALSRKTLGGRRFFILFLVFAIIFNAGIIPNYLIVKYTGIMDTIWALVIPDAVSAWNVLILVSFFSSLPPGLEEAARIDGANDFTIFTRIALPLAIPAVSTIGLFIAVSNWNALMDGIMYINNTALKPLQVYLMDIIVQSQNYDSISTGVVPSLSFKTAAIFVSTIPILIFYPFIQRYFTKGIMLGAIKG